MRSVAGDATLRNYGGWQFVAGVYEEWISDASSGSIDSAWTPLYAF